MVDDEEESKQSDGTERKLFEAKVAAENEGMMQSAAKKKKSSERME